MNIIFSDFLLMIEIQKDITLQNEDMAYAYAKVKVKQFQSMICKITIFFFFQTRQHEIEENLVLKIYAGNNNRR